MFSARQMLDVINKEEVSPYFEWADFNPRNVGFGSDK